MPKKAIAKTKSIRKKSTEVESPEKQAILIDYTTLAELVQLLENSQLTELELDTGNTRVWLSKNQQNPSLMSSSPIPVQSQMQSTNPSPSNQNIQTTDAKTVSHSSKTIELRSPMVGTFYSTPSPDSEPYVKVGDHVKDGQTLCIIEAMKLLNEIESEATGRIVEICVKNAQPIEFNTVLFRIDPSV